MLAPAWAALALELASRDCAVALVLVGKDAKAAAWVQRLFPEGYAKLLGGLTDALGRK